MPSSWFHATQKPIMMLTAGSDPWSDNACHVWTRLRGPRFALNLRNSEHITPSDAIWLTDGAIMAAGGVEKTVATVRDSIAAFLDVNMSLNRSANPRIAEFLAGRSADPDVEVTTQTQSSCSATDNVQNEQQLSRGEK